MIEASLKKIISTLKDGTQLVAVSKYHPISELAEAYDAGQRVFGESHVQELCAKYEALPKDIEWHFIGHLQTNKVKYIAPFVSLIHAVDSFRLMQEIDKQGKKNDRVISILLQVHVAKEETKFGFTPGELLLFMDSEEWKALSNVQIKGLMCMATNTDDEVQIRSEFAQTKHLFDRLKTQYFATDVAFCQLSMGMSGDYLIAQEEGSTLVRVGSLIFGERNYSAPLVL